MLGLSSHFGGLLSTPEEWFPLVSLQGTGSKPLARVSNLVGEIRVPGLGYHRVGCVNQ